MFQSIFSTLNTVDMVSSLLELVGEKRKHITCVEEENGVQGKL
jgi:hypothetical protein